MEEKKCLSLEDFTILMFGVLAKNSKIHDLDDFYKKIACLPFNYKQNIENILCADNRWKDMFSILLDVDDYFYDHFAWEMNFSYMINKVLGDFNKKIECDLVMDRFRVCFTNDEVNYILSKYDEEVINRMDHFTNLITDYIYTRQFQEMFYDYSANSVKKMQDLRKSEQNDISWCEKKSNKFLKLLRKGK